ncbi:hypothetical protein Taro_029410 [Colocasia esculenta]|uniref:Uncharacterized protein n=1 Tax=Colocasia esculenta TaxID=4460 RepID=A0A843VX43_COLES|nr:hypothetical protein [Colocasia esculenta]
MEEHQSVKVVGFVGVIYCNPNLPVSPIYTHHLFRCCFPPPLAPPPVSSLPNPVHLFPHRIRIARDNGRGQARSPVGSCPPNTVGGGIQAQGESLLSSESIFRVLARETTQNEGQYHLDRAGGYGQGSLKGYQCAPQCSRRCSQTQYKKPCLFFCNKCCAKCLCVPPGYYGNKGVCPCYNNWKTKRGGPKCP